MIAGTTSWKATAGRAGLVFAGCALGALLSSKLRFPQVGSAIVFLPYAVLTALLLVEEPRRYWVLLAASAAGNFLPHLRTGPAPFVLFAEVANFTRALVVVFLVRRFSRPGAFFDLRGLSVFLVAAVAVAPAVGALIGAFVVVSFRDASYWLVFRAWFFSNALTGITLLPAFSMLAASPRFARPSPQRVLEALALSSGLLAVGVLVFLGWSSDEPVLPASIYLPMPFLLWAAVRFGPRGVSAALVCVATLTIWGAIHGHGPFAMGSPTENLLDLQLFLLVVTIPMMLLSALVEQQRRTAEELGASRAQYQSVVEDQTEMICRFRPDGTYTFVNGAFRRHFALTEGVPAEGSVFELVPRSALGSLSPEHSVMVRETEIPGPSDQPSWQKWHVRGLFDRRGKLVEYQAVGRDVTPEKLREWREHELLGQREVERTLREMDRHKDEFLAMLGHELRNPLAPIGSALDLLRTAPNGEQSSRAREVIARQLGHLKRLVDDLLDVSRITRGDIRVELRALDATEVMEHVLETVRPLIESRGHELRVSLPEALLPIRCDLDRLAQVLINLLNNAAKYTKPGSGRIELSLREESGCALFCVRDNGIGIPKELLDRVFDLFERGAARPEHPVDGLGIGLTLARRLVELHDGVLTATSEGPGQGSTFIVRLPLAASEPTAPSEVEMSQEPVEISPLRILVVDDNVDAADSLAELLVSWGHEARSVYAGLDALSVARAERPDVVLSDLGLPDFGGFELARALRKDVRPETQLLVAITGFGQPGDRESSKDAGFDHHLVKPINLKDLERLLSSAPRRTTAEILKGA